MDSIEEYVLKYLRTHRISISFESLIGGGKSTLCKSIYHTLNKDDSKCMWYPEPINRPLINLFYSDIKRYAFPVQSIIIRERSHIYDSGLKFASEGGIAIIDRSRYGDLAFALMHRKCGNISLKEFDVYTKLIEDYPFPTNQIKLECGNVIRIVVYLDCTPEKCRERIIKRGNQIEIEGCTVEYLRDLEISHYKILKRQNLDEIEALALNEIERSSRTNKIIFIPYDKELNISTDGLICEDQVYEILYEIIKKINDE